MVKFKKAFLNIIRLILIGVLIGFFVATFQFISNQLGVFLKDVFINKIKWKVIVFLIALPLIIAYAFLCVKYNKNIVGGGIPALEYNLKYHKEKLNAKKDLPMMMFSALLTTCSYACLGTVLATSVVMGGNIPLLINEYFKVEDDDSVNIGMGAAFGSMLFSPICGIVYCFEESLKKFNVKLIGKVLLICLISFTITYLIYGYKTFSIDINAYLDLTHWYIFIIIQVGAFLYSTLLAFLIVKLKNLFIKYKNNFFVKYKAIFIFLIFVILAFFFGKYMGSGVSLIASIFDETIWYILFAILAFRFVLMILGVSSLLTGGVIIPTFAMGATFAMGLALLLNKIIGLDLSYANEIVILSILTFYVSTIERPFLGIALLFAFVSLDNVLYLLIPTTIMVFLANLITKFNKYPDLYDVLKNYIKIEAGD